MNLLLSEIPKEEFLEAVISAVRAVLQQLASKNIPQVPKTCDIIGDLKGWLEFNDALLQCRIQGVQIFRFTLK